MNNNREKHQYKLETLSKVILSPREQGAFYVALDDFSVNDSDKKIIYPFYQYGEYEKYQPEQTSYYIPGSSIKGMLVGEKKLWNNPKRNSNDLIVDDISIGYEKLELGPVYKFQAESVEKPQVVKLKSFFENVAFEMLREGTEVEGELFCEGELKTLIDGNKKTTLKMVNRLKQRLDDLILVEGQNEADSCKLRTVSEKLSSLLKDYEDNSTSFLALLGGYKGRTLSYLFDQVGGNQDEQSEGGIYIDKGTMLPYGLVKITLLDERNE